VVRNNGSQKTGVRDRWVSIIVLVVVKAGKFSQTRKGSLDSAKVGRRKEEENVVVVGEQKGASYMLVNAKLRKRKTWSKRKWTNN